MPLGQENTFNFTKTILKPTTLNMFWTVKFLFTEIICCLAAKNMQETSTQAVM